MLFHPTYTTISRYLDGALPGQKAKGFERHIADCEACRRKVEVLSTAARAARAPRERLDAVSRHVMDRVGERAWDAGAPVLGEIRSVRGIVLVRRGEGGAAGSGPAVEAFPGCVVREGDRLQPIDDASAVIEWGNGKRFRVREPLDLGAKAGAAGPQTPGHPSEMSLGARKRGRVLGLSWASVGVISAAAVAAALTVAFPKYQEAQRRREVARSAQEGTGGAPVALQVYSLQNGRGRLEVLRRSSPAASRQAPSTREAFYYRMASLKNGAAEDVEKRAAGYAGLRVIQTDFAALETEFESIARLPESAPADAEAYDRIVENPFLDVALHPLSTFSIDVDTASYANVRRFLSEGQLPPKNAVRIEEMVNYFSYDYPAPKEDEPFSASVEIADCPWNDAHRLVNIGLMGKEIPWENRPASNLVFLLDVSGSMQSPNKLPLVKESMQMLARNLTENDTVAMVVYAGASGLVLPPTRCDNLQAVLEAIDRLEAGGSTNGGAGIELAYQTAAENCLEGGVNRVILATDGDFNVGVTDQDALARLIEEKAKSGVFLSVLGFGMGNLKDGTLEQLADKGNGNYAYIDTASEARKALVEQISGTLIAIAKDVKIQVEFNPGQVAAYRLIGYENRMLRAEDFNDDTKDAGEIGAGLRVTALYEIVPAGAEATPSKDSGAERAKVDPLRYQTAGQLTEASASGETLTLKLRYKEPDGETSKLLEFPVVDDGFSLDDVSADFNFAAAVASFGMILRDSQYKGDATLETVLDLAEKGKGDDRFGYREEFIQLVEKARTLPGR
ncbi:MAG TPA: von Willebrand factor type A domain-containing protein [Sumerlaeia bacterium]|nr:von Willebrand factor type A domain-containing protein [Sumerlaeia bacterium]